MASLDDNLCTKVEIHFSCNDVPQLDVMSKSDPFLVVFTKIRGARTEVFRTETVQDDHYPKWTRSALLDYRFEEEQAFDVEVYDRDSSKEDLKSHQLIGKSSFVMGMLVASAGQHLELSLRTPTGQPAKKNSKSGKVPSVLLSCEEVSSGANIALSFDVRAEGLAKMDFFSKSDPYLEILRLREDGTWVPVFKSEVHDNTLQCDFVRFTLSLQKLCNGDVLRPLWIKCWDANDNARPDLIGELETTVSDLLDGRTDTDGSVTVVNNKRFTLTRKKNADKPKKKNKSYGTLIFKTVRCEKQNTFLDFIRGGMEVRCTFAIDFTASNGDPSDMNSLHAFTAGGNEYQRAISKIGTILEPYDTDNMIPVYGFGARVNDTVEHCFPLTLDSAHDEVKGVKGILDAYQTCIRHPQVRLSGPTLFEQIIRTATAKAASEPFTRSFQHFDILVILTDGVICDMQKTVNAIVAASECPLSVIIVGVGMAEFDRMETLDADETKLRDTNGKFAIRDIVQFVPFRRFAGDVDGLARETLAEVPGQILEYMRQNGFVPLANRRAPEKFSAAGMASRGAGVGTAAGGAAGAAAAGASAPPPY